MNNGLKIKGKINQINHLPGGNSPQEFKSVPVSNDVVVHILPHSHFEFLISVKDVALGYDVKESTLRDHIYRNKEELKEGVHYVRNIDIYGSNTKGVGNTDTLCKNYQPNKIVFTKSGVIRLGFFIKSERAKLFRDWAEQVIMEKLQHPAPLKQLPVSPKRKHNRLNSERLISILEDVAEIDDTELRKRIVQKLVNY